MTKSEEILPLDLWLEKTILEATEKAQPQVEANSREANILMSYLRERVMMEFPNYKAQVSYAWPKGVWEVLHQGVMGRLTRLEIKENKLFGKKVMTIDMLSHGEGNDVKYNFSEFESYECDKTLAGFIKQYFRERNYM